MSSFYFRASIYNNHGKVFSRLCIMKGGCGSPIRRAVSVIKDSEVVTGQGGCPYST